MSELVIKLSSELIESLKWKLGVVSDSSKVSKMNFSLYDFLLWLIETHKVF